MRELVEVRDITSQAILKYDFHNLMKFSVFNQSHLVPATNFKFCKLNRFL